MRVKYLFSFVLLLGMSLLCSPNSVASTVNGFDKSDVFSKNASFSSSILNGASGSIDPGMLIYPKYNCDPEMCITTVPDIDPGFLIRDRQNNR
jgi:hypothetical protein